MKTLLLASVAVAGFAVAGLAQDRNGQDHVMTVRLPNGIIEQIAYSGDIPPRVAVAPEPVAMSLENPFAMLERISAVMDRQAAALLRAAMDPGFAAPGGLTEATLGQPLAPGQAGGQSFSFVSTLSGAGVCSRGMSITYPGNGAQPKVVSHQSGDCGPAAGGAANEAVAAPTTVAPNPAPRTIEVKAQGPSNRPIYANLVRPVSDPRD